MIGLHWKYGRIGSPANRELKAEESEQLFCIDENNPAHYRPIGVKG
jgi:hypothetical protein